MAFPPRGFEKSRVQLRVQLNETLEMCAGRWHQRCLGKEKNSARPLAARITGYFSRASMRNGANDRSWYIAADSECPLIRRLSEQQRTCESGVSEATDPADAIRASHLQAKLANVLEGDVSRSVDRVTDQKAGAVLSGQPI